MKPDNARRRDYQSFCCHDQRTYSAAGLHLEALKGMKEVAVDFCRRSLIKEGEK